MPGLSEHCLDGQNDVATPSHNPFMQRIVAAKCVRWSSVRPKKRLIQAPTTSENDYHEMSPKCFQLIESLQLDVESFLEYSQEWVIVGHRAEHNRPRERRWQSGIPAVRAIIKSAQ